MDKEHVNSQGACYFAVNFLGWATAKTPWEALAKLDLNMSGKRVIVGGPKFLDQTEGVNLYYLPDESIFQGTEFFAPVDKDRKPYGIPIYAGLNNNNEKIIKQSLMKAI